MTFTTLQTIVSGLCLAGPAEQPPAEQPPVERPTTQQPTAEQPAAEEPAGEQPAAEAKSPNLTDPFKSGEAAPEGPEVKDPFRSAPTAAPGPATQPAPATAPAAEQPPKRSVRRRYQQKTWPDRPIKYRLDLAFGAGTNHVRDSAHLAFDDNRNMPVLNAAFRADFRLAKSRVFLGGGAGYRRLWSEGAVHDDVLRTEVLLREPIVLLRLSVMAVEGVDPFVELSGGPSIIDVALDANNDADQRKVTGYFTGLGGVALYLPKKWLPRKGASRVSAGIETGLGYTFRPALQLDPTPDVDEDESIGTSTAEYGDVAFRGLTWRLGLFVRLM
jgi:hypothetical protein